MSDLVSLLVSGVAVVGFTGFMLGYVLGMYRGR